MITVRTRDEASALADGLQGQAAPSGVTTISHSGSPGGHGNFPVSTGTQLARSQHQCATYSFLESCVWFWHSYCLSFLLIMQMSDSTHDP